MIETLNGIRETVNFSGNSKIRLYDNTATEYYPSHWHTPLEIIMPIQNPYPVTCCNIRYDLQEGEVLLINPGTIHSCQAAAGNRLIFQADFTQIHGIRELGATLSLVGPALHISSRNYPLAHAEIQQLLLEIADEYFADAPLGEAAVYARLLQIFVLIGRGYAPAPDAEQSDNRRTLQKHTERFLLVCDYINEHFAETLTLDNIARQSGFSKYHFSRLFKQFTNVSFYKYLNTKRIENAEKLLIDRELTVTEAALRSGFSSLSAFNRMFKLIKNCTPSEFKAIYMP